jgi:hypothetical protein
VDIPAGNTDLMSILRAYNKANGPRSLLIIVAIGFFWLMEILIRVNSFL